MNNSGSQEVENIKFILRNIIESELAISLKEVSNIYELSKLNVDTDDWSFLVIPAIENHFSLKIPVKEWSKVNSIEEIEALIIKSKRRH